MRATASARSAMDSCGQGPASKAVRAAATARSASAVVVLGTRPTSSPVAGDVTSTVPPPPGSTHEPPMNTRS